MRARLRINPEPLRVVARRMGEPDVPRSRCDHEDGRGRCTSRETVSSWNPAGRYVETFCARHERERGG